MKKRIWISGWYESGDQTAINSISMWTRVTQKNASVNQVDNHYILSWNMLSLNGLLKGEQKLWLFVSRADIQKFALANALQFGIFPENFRASNCWLDGFLLRHELPLRKSTTLFKLEDDEVV